MPEVTKDSQIEDLQAQFDERYISLDGSTIKEFETDIFLIRTQFEDFCKKYEVLSGINISVNDGRVTLAIDVDCVKVS